MVTELMGQYVASLPTLIGEAESTDIMLQRLSPLNQLRVIMGLFAVVILGLVLYIVIKAGSHMVKGMSAPANRLRTDSLPAADDWARKPLNEFPLPDDETPSNKTQAADSPTDDGE